MLAINQRRDSRGLTLIEVLIAIVIFAIGLLGIAALQVAGLRYTKGSQERVVATMQAENIVDRMRANMVGVDEEFYLDPSAESTDCDLAACTPEELADYDFERWESATRAALGASATDTNVNATICVDATPYDGDSTAWDCDDTGEVWAVKIEWLERTVEQASAGIEDTYEQGGVTSAGIDGFVRRRFVMWVIP